MAEEEVSDKLRRARQSLKAEIVRLSGKIGGEHDQTKRDALIKKVKDNHNAIEAIESTHLFLLSQRTARYLTIITAIAALSALLLNTYVFFVQQNAKRIDAAVTWCTNFNLPGFIKYQAMVRQFEDPESPYWLPDKADLQKYGNLKLGEVLASLKGFDHKAFGEGGGGGPDNSMQVALVSLLNFMDAGALLAYKGDLDKDIFSNCFTTFATAYFHRYDHSYVGLAQELATKSTKNPNEPMERASTGFPFIAREIFGDTSEANKKAIQEQLETHPS